MQKSDPAVLKKVTALLATDKDDRLTRQDIASEATWADVLREKSQEARSATGAWHSTRLSPEKPDIAVACFGHKPLPEGYPASHGPQDNCSVDKVRQFAAELKNPDTTPHERLVALQFLLNLVGDLNDPMHAIDRNDQGGACIAVQVGAKPPVRLSTYWQDTLVREAMGGDPVKGAARLAAAISPADAQNWSAGDPASWAQDTFEVAKNVAYAFGAEQPAGKTALSDKGQSVCPSSEVYRVGPDYEAKALAAVKEQLAKGGVRLATVLRDSLK